MASLQCGTAAVITDNLSVHFTFDSSAFDTDSGKVTNSIGSGNNAAIVPGTTVVSNPTGIIGQAAHVSQNTTVPPTTQNSEVGRIVADSNTTGNVGDGSFSMSLWFNADALTYGASAITPQLVSNGRGNSSTVGWSLALRSDPNQKTQLLFSATASGGVGYTEYNKQSASFTANNWFQVGVTFDAVSRELVLYTNGEAILTTSIASTVGSLDNSATFLTFFTNNRNTYPFSGALDDFGLWSGRVLTEAEMTSIYTQGLAGQSLLTAIPEPGVVSLAGMTLFGLLSLKAFSSRRKRSAAPGGAASITGHHA